MNKNRLLSLLSKGANKKVYFGPQGFIVAANEQDFDSFQQGFGVHSDGSDLCGLKAGDWQRSWLVIAIDTELGDPYFVDCSDKNLPVYTALCCEGLWQKELVATSLHGFLQCLELLFEQGQQKNAQFVPDETTLTDIILLAQLKDNLVKSSQSESFWALFFECYFDWLNDDD